jgi:hypothetical protein
MPSGATPCPQSGKFHLGKMLFAEGKSQFMEDYVSYKMHFFAYSVVCSCILNLVGEKQSEL